MKPKYALIFLLILLLFIILIPSCYAILGASLKINGQAKIIGNWNISITNVEATKICVNCDAGTPSFSNTSLTFNASLMKPGDSITYEVTISNNGNIDATLKDITTNQDDTSVLQIITSPPLDVLKAGESTLVYITIYYDNSLENIETNITNDFICNINYVQKVS